MPDRPEVTAVEIARLAGVGRAAVSNWRRRHPDFPQPAGGTDTSPTFRLDEVERWLRGQGKIAELPLLERVRQQLETLRDPDGHPAAPLLAGGALLLQLHRDPAGWQALREEPDTRLATALPRLLQHTAQTALGPDGAALLALPRLAGATYLDLVRMLERLAAEHGPADAYEQLLARHGEAAARPSAATPPEAAALLADLADLAGPADQSDPDGADRPAGTLGTVLDPACGLGALLLAAGPGADRRGQDLDPVHTALALLRLALHTPPDAPAPLALDLRPGDSLRADAHPGLAADAVLCQPPYNERDWGHDELQYDSRWPGGLVPPRGESELAWVLHCLAHTRPGGLAALLLPPTVASRRAGRRIRAELVRSGALRAVVALPAGTAPPYGVPLHLWLLRGPRPGDDFRRVLLLDAAAAHPAAEGGRDRVDWPALHRTVLDTWQAFDTAARSGAPLPADRPGVHRAVPALDLLDDETDLSPARHLPAAAPDGGAAALHHLQSRLAELLAGPADPVSALPAVADTPSVAGPSPVTVGELARAGALEVHSSGQGVLPGPAGDGPSGLPVLTDQDLLAGTAPTATTAVTAAADGPLTTRPGDVLVPALGGGTARVVQTGGPLDGVALGPRLHLLRPDPAQLDPDFLAGVLRATGSARRASSYASTTTRLDVRRVELPRVPPERQRVLGAAFRRIAEFEAALDRAAALGRSLAQGLTDGLATGGLTEQQHGAGPV
ncbi:N-6 DNA methylase [Kitasatospora sp. DSM 101779]|uniref:N-6 DNA methylase n=1 Tax=Kitasatospora sp. DSM 101779 TaxID=2853165 RepID=UPI0021D9C069|nr:N-6 DNA methylase [Kitasatospora sp. DSM 101779]MCU7823126.1 N-6 DNA methylase [Kitasatospora sp. DSM 101779]